jgi:hypothetical protein
MKSSICVPYFDLVLLWSTRCIIVFALTLMIPLPQVMNLICGASVKMRHLERVLSKKRDHTARLSYLEELAAASPSGTSAVQLFWGNAMGELKDLLASLSRVCPFIDSVFQNEYPKFLRLFTDLCARISQQGGPDHNVTPLEQHGQDVVACYAAIAPFER